MGHLQSGNGCNHPFHITNLKYLLLILLIRMFSKLSSPKNLNSWDWNTYIGPITKVLLFIYIDSPARMVGSQHRRKMGIRSGKDINQIS